MFSWFKLLVLRMQTIAVVELEYGRKLDVAMGPDTQLFNAATRAMRDAGGNQYDAAAAFVLSEVGTLMAEEDQRDSCVAKIMTAVRLMPMSHLPEVAANAIDRMCSPGLMERAMQAEAMRD